jgi:ABC-type multidrug transport system ATPase subunit
MTFRPPTSTSNTTNVRLESVTKSLGAVHAVRGVDLTIVRDETIVVLRPNGAGKSTVLDMLVGLLNPDAETASILGRVHDIEVRGAGLEETFLELTPPTGGDSRAVA